MSKRGFISMAIAVLIATTFVAQVSAQGQDRQQGQGQGQGQGRRPGGIGRGGPGGPGGFGLAGLLMMEEVRKEIELLDDQQAEIQKFAEALRAEQRPQDGQQRNFQDLTEEERAKLREEFTARMRETNKKVEAKLAEVLLPHQLERLKELEVQQQGTRALTNNESVISALTITDEQKAKIEAIQDANREKIGALFQQGGGQEGDREANRAKFEELRKSGEAEVLAVLSDEQKKKFDELKGEKFEFPAFNFGGGRGGPGGGDRRRDGDNNNRPQRPDA